MRPDFRTPRHSAGFGLVAALFLMIVVTVIIMSIARTLDNGTCPAGSPGLSGSLSEYSVAVTCVSSVYTEDTSTVAIYRLTATAQNGTPGSRPDYAYRQLTAVVER